MREDLSLIRFFNDSPVVLSLVCLLFFPFFLAKGVAAEIDDLFPFRLDSVSCHLAGKKKKKKKKNPGSASRQDLRSP